MLIRSAILAGAFLLSSFPAHSGTLTCNGAPCNGYFAAAQYAGSRCQPPSQPAVDVSSSKARADSRKRAKDYLDKDQAYLNCLADEANADMKDLGAAIEASVKHQEEAEKNRLVALQNTLDNRDQPADHRVDAAESVDPFMGLRADATRTGGGEPHRGIPGGNDIGSGAWR